MHFFKLRKQLKELACTEKEFRQYESCFPELVFRQRKIAEAQKTVQTARCAMQLMKHFTNKEISKYLKQYSVNIVRVLKRKEFNEPMDGIVYGVVVSLGFATYENYDYVYRLALEWKEYGVTQQDVAIWRSYSAVPMHGLNGCLMGFYLGKYVFTGDKKFLGYSFFAPFLIHGIYNYYVQFGVLIVIVQLIFALKF